MRINSGFTAERYHDLSVGHRVVGHEGKCRFLHGHNYRVHFVCESAELDGVGRVVDFGVIKERLCMWLEENWDHKTLLWEKDDAMRQFISGAYEGNRNCEDWLHDCQEIINSFVWMHFNPTAENMAQYLAVVIGPEQLKGTGVFLRSVRIEETRKCSASYTLPA